MRRRVSRFVVSVCLAAIFHIGLLWGVVLVLDDEGGRSVPASRPQTMAIEYVSSDKVMREFELFDPRPLLIPTRYNYANVEYLSDVLEEEKQIFPAYEPMYRTEAGDFISTFGNRWRGIEGPQEVGTRFGEHLFEGLGSAEEGDAVPLKNVIELAMLAPATGEVVFHKVYSSTLAMEIAQQWPDWRPARFLASVEGSFLSTRMNVLDSSGYEDLDLRLEALLAGQLIEKGVFEDGPYIVEVGP